MLIDTHAHLDFENYVDVPLAIEEMKASGVERIIIPGVEPEGFDKILKLINMYEEFYGAIGVHPSEAEKVNNDVLKNTVSIVENNKKIVAIGEIGLDYHENKDNKELQKKVFIQQLEIAKVLNLPVLIHDRDAHKDTFDILKENKIEKCVLHCFSGSAEFMKQCVKEGWYIALGGVVTFKNAKIPKEVAKEVPLERLLLETDSPFLAPTPFRGKDNHPKYLKLVASEIAQIKDIPYNKVEEITTKNALELFSIK